VAGHLTNDDIKRVSGRRLSPSFIARLNRWSARPTGLITLEFIGMASAAALGFALAQHGSSAPALKNQLEAGRQQVRELRSELEGQRQLIAGLTQQKAELGRENESLKKQAEDNEERLISLAAEKVNLIAKNERVKRAVEVFRSREIRFPRSPAPLPIRVPKATVVAIRQGAKEGVLPDGQGGFVVVRRPSPNVVDALKKGLRKPAQVALLTPPELVRGGKAIDLQSPISTVLRPGPVTLRWSRVGGAASYTVLLRDDKGADVLGKDAEKIKPKETPFGAEWTTPSALGPGTYRWQVIAHLGEGAEGKTLSAGGKQAGFAVLDARKTAEIKAAEAQFAGNALELGVRYARLGMLDDAEAALIPFVAAYPDSPQTKRLLEQVRSWRQFKN
jgi:hypothetical protein